MSETADVVIIGGGVIGASIAFNLAKRGIREVIIVEKNFIASGATGKSSACIRQHYSTECTSRMVLRSLRVFENFADVVGGSAGFIKAGFLMGVPEKDRAVLEKTIVMQRRVGINTSVIGPDEISEIEPRARVDDLAAGAWEPDSGYADPSDTTASFVRRARELGVRLRQNTTVLGLKTAGGAITEVHTDHGSIGTSTVINAAGVWGDRVAAMAGVSIPLTVCRHQIRFVKRPAEASTPHPLFYDLVHQIYTRPEGRDLTLIGSMNPAEINDRADPDRYNEGVDFEGTAEVVGC